MQDEGDTHTVMFNVVELTNAVLLAAQPQLLHQCENIASRIRSLPTSFRHGNDLLTPHGTAKISLYLVCGNLLLQSSAAARGWVRKMASSTLRILTTQRDLSIGGWRAHFMASLRHMHFISCANVQRFHVSALNGSLQNIPNHVFTQGLVLSELLSCLSAPRTDALVAECSR